MSAVTIAPSVDLPCHHSLQNITGYIVRRTFPGTSEPHQDVREFGEFEYGDAIELAHEIRRSTTDAGSYAVVDTVYFCGCRGQG